MLIKKKYKPVATSGDPNIFHIHSFGNQLGSPAIKLGDEEQPIFFETIEEAEFFCDALQSQRYDHIIDGNTLKFFNDTHLPIIQIARDKLIRQMEWSGLVPTWFPSFPKVGDRLIALKTIPYLSLVEGEDVHSLDDEEFETLAASKKLLSEGLSLQDLTLDEWLDASSGFAECEDWICRLFGFHSLAEVVLCLKD